MKPINYADLIAKARREGKGLYADFVIALEETLTEIEMQRGKIERLEAARTEGVQKDAKNAARWNMCLRLRAFPVRLGSPLYKDGGYVTWTINGQYYGGTENECVDDAINALDMNMGEASPDAASQPTSEGK